MTTAATDAATGHWLFKSEPEVFGIDHLAAMPDGIDHWDGIRNYQARNFMRDAMKVGDSGFFYHSNCKVPGIVGTVEIVREAYPDHTAQDASSPYFDPKATPANPRWVMVDVAFRERFAEPIPLAVLRETKGLEAMPLVRRGSRLSINPVTARERAIILALARRA